MPLGTHQKIFLAWGIFGTLGILAFIRAKSPTPEERREAVRVRQELRDRLAAEKDQ